eukprot:6317364-Amphidinium_carterae.1
MLRHMHDPQLGPQACQQVQLTEFPQRRIVLGEHCVVVLVNSTWAVHRCMIVQVIKRQCVAQQSQIHNKTQHKRNEG